MSYNLLDQISGPNDVKNIKPEERKELAREIRRFLMEQVSKTGGHLASNLGAVELTIALHLVLDFPQDKLIWDVGHQSYTHKILTGRKEGFAALRQFGGMSGFPKRKESDCDAFDVGHSSTSISAAIGFAKARDIKGERNRVFAVIGDGALSGGMAYEALNNAARLDSNLVIVLNDNNMSITENVGGMANYLGKIRTGAGYQNLKSGVESTLRGIPVVGNPLADRIKRSKDTVKRLFISGMLFEDMGITYIGPIDGHNIEEMRKAFTFAQRAKEAVLVHVITKKGKGYSHAEQKPAVFHGVEPFHIKTGEARKKSPGKSYTQIFGDTLIELAKKDQRIVAVCAAMPSGTGLMEYRNLFPERYFDVGIAEEHAVTFAGGLAAGGLKPVVAIYSTFLQRAYDQILHDVCLENLPVVFAVDRAGLVGSDGETHQGIFDVSFLSSIPNLTIMAPASGAELSSMLEFALKIDGPVAIRYPRGQARFGKEMAEEEIVFGKGQLLGEDSSLNKQEETNFHKNKVALLAVGSMAETACEVRRLLRGEGVEATAVNVRFIKPFDKELFQRLLKDHTLIVTLEENVETGGFGQMVGSWLMEEGRKEIDFLPIALPDAFIEQGTVPLLKEKFGLNVKTIAERILERI